MLKSHNLQKAHLITSRNGVTPPFLPFDEEVSFCGAVN